MYARPCIFRIESGGDVDIKGGVLKLGSGANRRLMYRSGNNDVILEADSGDFYRQDIANSTHEFFTGNNERLRITSTGKVLINTISSINSQAYLEVQGGTTVGQTNYIQTWKGDSDNIAIRNHVGGDYEFVNSQEGNELSLYDGTGGVRMEYYDSGNYMGVTGNHAYSNYIANQTTSAGSYVRVHNGGELKAHSSSRRFKDNIREYVGIGVSAIKQIVPKLWEDYEEGTTKLGFIAEEIHDIGLTDAVIYSPYIGGSEIGIGVTYGDSYGNGSTPVTKTGEALDDEVLVVQGIEDMSIVAELVIAIKQLTARIEKLESGG